MKTSNIPALRVSPEVREAAESVLEHGETLTSFVLEALDKNIEYRKSRREFIARGLASATKAKRTGKYVSADRVIEKLSRRLDKAKRRAP